MSARAATLAPLAALVALVVLTTRNAALITVAVSLFALGLVVGGRVHAGVGAQRIALAVTSVAGFFLGASLAPEAPGVTDRITGIWSNLTMALTLPALLRALFARPEFGARMTLALGVFAFALAGQLRVSQAFAPLAWTFVGLCLAAMRADDTERPRMRAIPLSRWLSGAAVLGTAVLTVAALSRALPPLHARAVASVMRALRGTPATGFDEQFSLGSLDALLVSEEIVARVYGPAPEMLRGVVYDRYERGSWLPRGAGVGRVAPTPVGPLRGTRATMVESVGPGAPVYLLPLDHEALATQEGVARFDLLGAVHRLPGDASTRVWFRMGPRRHYAPAPPSPEDTLVPQRVAARIAPLAAAWTAGARDHEDRVERIVRALRGGYRYRLAVRRSARVDPVVDFLFRHREGNCEYFASATALLARAAGVPTRVVGGYRVGEYNALGRFHVVRDRNAHAWVEVWNGRDAWVTVDPTPERAIPANLPHRAPALRALVDALAAWLVALRRGIAALTATQLLTAAGLLFAGWLGWRRWRARRGGGGDRRTFAAEERPLPCLARLDAELARRGLGRAHGETLARHAARVEASDELPAALRDDVARALRDYAALRYGGGEERAVAKAMNDCADRLRARFS